MIKYLYILIILYNLNLFLNTFNQIMIKNITLFNYKNTTQWTKNKFFYDIIINFYLYKNKFSKISFNFI